MGLRKKRYNSRPIADVRVIGYYQVLKNTSGGWHPDGDRTLAAGDMIYVDNFDDISSRAHGKVRCFYKPNPGKQFPGGKLSNYVYFDEIKFVDNSELVKFEQDHKIDFKVDIDKDLFEQLNWLSYSEVAEWFELYKNVKRS